MILSLIDTTVKTTPTTLAKEIIMLHGRDGLGRVRSILNQRGNPPTERELEQIHKHCLTIHNRVCKNLGLDMIDEEILKTIYPLEVAYHGS
ncbi:hypothetical protein [Moellerella wisconsensis]|uniref:hypothetical protein n=1 Tax=Moellerella wisconsensis TaxID=158849 RepID=UPI00064182A5|nr:hypothetical protein [Moellerella wisconsensis]KLN95703.1 hypothetical protein VK86_14440 [Moellerella wisconsensis]